MRLRPSAFALLAVALFAGPAATAPWPSPRPPAAVPAPAFPVGTRAAPAEATRTLCGTRLDAVMQALAAGAARVPATPMRTTYSRDVDGIAVLEDDGTLFYPNATGVPVLDIAAACRAFYRSHGDDYDQVAFWCASSLTQFIVAPTALAASWMVRNPTQGLGLSLFDVGATVGSPARLQAVLTMNSLARYPDDPDQSVYADTPLSAVDVVEHEFGHQWLAYVRVDSAGTDSHALLGRDWQHWNFFTDSDSSVMGGNDWVPLPADSFHSDGGYATYSPLDQYLMGLRGRAELDSFFVVDDPTAFDPPGVYTPPSDPLPGLGLHGRATWWHLADIERRNGVRVPDVASSPHAFRVAFVLIVPPGMAPTAADLAKLQAVRARFQQRFVADTQGRGAMDVSLASRPGTVQLAHVPLHDVESAAAPLPVGLAASIAGGSLGLAIDPASVALHWRSGTAGEFATLALAAAGSDSFTTALPPLPAGPVQYWFSAASDAGGLSAQLPAGGPEAPFAFTVGPDLVPPVIATVPLPRQGVARLPQALLARITDNLGVDSAWCEVAVDGGPAVRLPAARAGADSFVVSVGSGLAAGQSLTWRFLARDASAARNLAGAPAGWDTLRVGHDWYEDFEHPAAGWQHGPVLWAWRDQWHLEALPVPAGGGTAWHCGGSGGEPYGPHGDAMLVSPAIYDIVSGTSVTFAERHALEAAGPGTAYDAARLELQSGAGAWLPVEPVPGYTHVTSGDGMGFGPATPCWSGDSGGWVTRTLDLSPWAPGPVRLRVRQVSDDLVSFDGTWVDAVRVRFPGDAVASAPRGPVVAAIGAVRPNPSRGALALSLTLPAAARVEWSLHDVQGRRVARLWAGTMPAGPGTLQGQAPAGLRAGLYFSRVTADGRALGAQRIVLAR